MRAITKSKNIHMKKILFISLCVLIVFQACKSMNKTQKGTAAGAAVGATAGALIFKNTAAGAILGAVIGGSAGYAIGHHMDKQAKEIKQAVPDAQVERVGEGIQMTFNSALLFKINSADLGDSATANLDKLAGVFVKYPETNILVEGHTDNTGTDEFNMQLSEKRAKSVAGYLQGKGVPVERFTIKWYGETQPKFPNDSEAEREKNRRVELAVYANDDMKKEAQQGKLSQ
jgi:outer membrane protein OmpA-like peptidoglycan-associated protein